MEELNGTVCFFSLGLPETHTNIYIYVYFRNPLLSPLHTHSLSLSLSLSLSHTHTHTHFAQSLPLPHHLSFFLNFPFLFLYSSSELDSSLFRRSSAFSFMLSFYHTNWLHHFWTSLIFLPLLSHQTFFCQLILAVLGLRGACLCFTL